MRIIVPLNPHQSDIGNRCRHGHKFAAPRRVALRQPLGNLSRSCVALLHGPASYFRCPHGKRNATPTRPRHPVTRCAALPPSLVQSLSLSAVCPERGGNPSARGSSLGALTGGAAARARRRSLSLTPRILLFLPAPERPIERPRPHTK